MAKQSKVLSADEFRDRSRREYEDRRAEGKLGHARATCVDLDTKADVRVRMDASSRGKTLFLWIYISCLTFPYTQFNRFWLDPATPELFPPGLLEALEELWSSSSSGVLDPGPPATTKPGEGTRTDAGTATRLKAQMQADALRPLHSVSAGGDEDEDDERLLSVGTGVDSDRKDPAKIVTVWPEETLLQVGDYLRLSVSDSPANRSRPCLVSPSYCSLAG